MSESVRQTIQDTAQKFGVSCPAFRITAVNSAAERGAQRYPVLYYPQPAQPFSREGDEHRSQPTLRNQRSLNLAAEPVAARSAADHNDFDSVLPELPGEAYRATNALPATFAADESDDDDASLDDSSIENRPPETPLPTLSTLPQQCSSKQSLSEEPTIVKGVLYAPPPSPSLSQHDDTSPKKVGLDTLPDLLSRVLTDVPQTQDAAIPTTDSSCEELPTPPPLTAPAHPFSPPPQSEEDFTPSLAKFLDGLPPTPTMDLPSSENSEEMASNQIVSPPAHAVPVLPSTHDEAVREALLEENVNDVQPPHPDFDATKDLSASEGPLLPIDGNRTFQDMENTHLSDKMPAPLPAEILAQNPFDSINGHSLSREAQVLPPPLVEEELPQFNGDCFSAEVVSDKDVISDTVSQRDPPDSSKDRVGSGDLPDTAEQGNHVGTPTATDSTVDGSLGMSMGREPQGIEEELPTMSLFDPDLNAIVDSSSAKPRVRPAAYRGEEASFQNQGMRSLSDADERRQERLLDGKRGTRAGMADAASRVSSENGVIRDGTRVLDTEMKRNLASVSDHQSVGNSLTSPSNRNFGKYDKAPQRNGTKPNRNVTNATDGTLVDRRLPVSRAGYVDEMEADTDLLARKRGRKGSGWLRSRDEEEIPARKEHSRREKLRSALDDVERNRRQLYLDGELSPGEPLLKRAVVSDANSDSDQEAFLDARDGLVPAITSVPNTRYTSSKRRHNSRHRKGSRHEHDHFGGSSSSDDVCEECAHHRRYEPYHHEEVSHSRRRSRSKPDSSRRRVYGEEDDSQSDTHTDHRSTSSRSRSRSGRSSHDGHRSESLSRDRSHRSKKSSSRDKRRDHIDKPERYLRSEKGERELSRGRSRSSDRKRSHEKSSSKSSSRRYSSHDEPEKRRREGKNGKSRSKHRKTHSPPPPEYTNKYREKELKSIYRHRLPDSDSGTENPIPWYCEGQSAPEETDVETAHGHDSSDSETHAGDLVEQSVSYSSYGKRDKHGRRRRAHHNRSVTFLYDDL